MSDARPTRSSTQIDAYNREDCIATLAAARLAARAARARRSSGSARSRCPEPSRAEAESRRDKAERAALRETLLDGGGEELAAQLLDYHDRERKPVWWAFFDRLEMTPEELVEDAESIGGLEPDRRAASR